MADWQIREATPGDIPEIQSVAEAGWQATYGDILDSETIDAALAEWYDEQSLEKVIEDETVGYFVAEAEQVVGYCSGSGTDGTGYLGAIYVDPDEQRSGIGTALLDRFEQWARSEGCTELRIEVIADNEAGRRFYETRGYQIRESEERDVFGESVSVAIFGGPIDG
jgi:ribosomal protein S18 acetylase RimI-like enzyme